MAQAKAILILLVGLVATDPALAQHYSIDLKPPAAAIAKGRAAKPIVFRVLDTDAFCRAGGGRARGHIVGCQGVWKATGQPIIVVPLRTSAAKLRRIMDHEYAHVGGWHH